ncbi:MAG: hypothetical protein LC748_09900 [Thermomicrobia bacterium]|nr:hypothetical protein [Thermomicrobia bacterium]
MPRTTRKITASANARGFAPDHPRGGEGVDCQFWHENSGEGVVVGRHDPPLRDGVRQRNQRDAARRQHAASSSVRRVVSVGFVVAEESPYASLKRSADREYTKNAAQTRISY